MRSWQELAIETAFPGSTASLRAEEREVEVQLAAPIKTWLGRSITSFVVRLGGDDAVEDLRIHLHDPAVPYEPNPDYLAEDEEILKRLRAALNLSESRKRELLGGSPSDQG